MIKALVLAAAAAFMLAGCASVSAQKTPGADLARVKRVYIEQRLNDNHGIARLLVEELQRHGKEASAGPLTMLPDDADAVLTYEDGWTFDFTTHMISLTVELREARRNQDRLATARSYRPSVTRKSPEEIVREVVASLWK
jgi:hypothetical protein